MKYEKYSPAKFVNFVHICVTGGRDFQWDNFHSNFSSKMVTFPRVRSTRNAYADGDTLPNVTKMCNVSLPVKTASQRKFTAFRLYRTQPETPQVRLMRFMNFTDLMQVCH